MRSWPGWPTSIGMQQIEMLFWRQSGAASALQGCQAKGLQHNNGAVACSFWLQFQVDTFYQYISWTSAVGHEVVLAGAPSRSE
jgi:hypothetical protein